ncbi:MAG: hypothetical protein M3331_06220 [Actinomycetota bacterium]|nr:hypothetical protein [Actinomycetota bacterium]
MRWKIDEDSAPDGDQRDHTDGRRLGGFALRQTLTALGFQPLVEREFLGAALLSPSQLPLQPLSQNNQEVVWASPRHHAGELDVVESGATLTGFGAHDPETANCEIEIDGLPPAGEAAPA